MYDPKEAPPVACSVCTKQPLFIYLDFMDMRSYYVGSGECAHVVCFRKPGNVNYADLLHAWNAEHTCLDVYVGLYVT